MSSANSDSFTSSLPMWMTFVSVSCITAETRTSNIMLNIGSESRDPYLVLGF